MILAAGLAVELIWGLCCQVIAFGKNGFMLNYLTIKILER